MSLRDLMSLLFGPRKQSRLDVAVQENEEAAREAGRSILKSVLEDTQLAHELRGARQRDMDALLDDTLAWRKRKRR